MSAAEYTVEVSRVQLALAFLERYLARCFGPKRWLAMSLAASLTRAALTGSDEDLDELVRSLLKVDP